MEHTQLVPAAGVSSSIMETDANIGVSRAFSLSYGLFTFMAAGLELV